MYSAISAVLERLDAPYSAAEMHGLLSAFLCASADRSDNAWLNDVMAHSTPADEATATQCRKVLLSLHAHVLHQLDNGEFQFNLLLPADSTSLSERSRALGQWCQGFSYGLGLGGLKNMRALSSSAREFIEDVLKFTRLDEIPDEIGADHDNETDNENAYMELREYLRVGVMTLYEDRSPPPATAKTLH
jgi:uncharacterized protein